MAFVRYAKSGFSLQSLVDGSSNWWTNSGTTSGEYYYNQTNIDRKPTGVYASSVYLEEGILGGLSNGQWAWGDQDSIGGSRLYVKVAAGDPDAQASGYVTCSEDYEFFTTTSGNTLGVTSFMISNSSETSAKVNIRFLTSSDTEMFSFDISIPPGYSPFTLNERFILASQDKIIVNSGVTSLSIYMSGSEVTT